jgi:serine phosphatase RsbU (regulator of sigma subunit)
MILRAFIVDDEPPARLRLRQLLTEAGDVLVVGEAGDAIAARSGIADTRPDVVFLDIEMPQVSGTTLASSLPEPRPYVVFATAFDRYALDAFAVDATDYLVKPITRARLSGTLTRLRDRLSRRSDLERDLVAASATQAALLPRALPVLAGYEASAVTLPARGVGGDFYLGQRVGSNRLVLALGDVSGKGMPAGLVASSVQARIETVARHALGTAGEMLADVNRALVATSDAGRFATLVYVDLVALAHTATFVNAGHLPILVHSPGTAPQWIASTGPALGILPEARFDQASIEIDAGATIVIYSDGVTETCDQGGEEFGEVRLLDAVSVHAAETPAGICQAVLDARRDFARGAPAADDVSVLVVKRFDREAASHE